MPSSLVAQRKAAIEAQILSQQHKLATTQQQAANKRSITSNASSSKKYNIQRVRRVPLRTKRKWGGLLKTVVYRLETDRPPATTQSAATPPPVNLVRPTTSQPRSQPTPIQHFVPVVTLPTKPPLSASPTVPESISVPTNTATNTDPDLAWDDFDTVPNNNNNSHNNNSHNNNNNNSQRDPTVSSYTTEWPTESGETVTPSETSSRRHDLSVPPPPPLSSLEPDENNNSDALEAHDNSEHAAHDNSQHAAHDNSDALEPHENFDALEPHDNSDALEPRENSEHAAHDNNPTHENSEHAAHDNNNPTHDKHDTATTTTPAYDDTATTTIPAYDTATTTTTPASVVPARTPREMADADPTLEYQGSWQTRKYTAPRAQPGMPTPDMAAAAAAKYNRDKKRIQKAVAKLEGDDDAQASGGCCIIL